MMRGRELSCAAVAAAVIMFMCVTAQVCAQKLDEFAASQKLAAAQNPPGVSFVVRLKDGQTRFRQGELIRLELAFSSSLPDTYHLDSATYDRSGRLQIDSFHIDPQDGVSDPLYDYFHFGSGFIGGGLRGNQTLEARPYVVGADLNEWYRFDRPGRYRLYVTSGRVARRRLGGGGQVTVASNMIEFEVVPAAAAWAKQTLMQAAGIIDARDARADRRSACRVLRFLGSEDAARAIIKRFNGADSDSGCEFEYDFGLRSTTHRAFAVAEMERQLAAPEHAVTAEFVHVLSFLSFMQQNIAPLPPYPEHGADEAIKLWRKEYDRRWELYGETVNRYTERLAAVVFTKEGAARAVSLDALISLRADAQRAQKRPAEAQTDRSLTGALVSVFADLPVATQGRLLEDQWPLVSGPEMLPVLRRIYQNPPKGNDMLPGDALRHIYELSPGEGRQLIIEELRRRSPRVRIDVLGLLPDETLPEVDALVVERLGAGAAAFDDLFLQLVERYATAAVAPQLKEAYAEKIGLMACAPQSALLAYFLRVEPTYGSGLIEKALASRKQTGCYRFLLTDVARLHMSDELERIAVTSLDDPDPELAAAAAGVLGSYGSAAARDALLHRFERWHEEWAGREKELLAQDESDVAAQAQTRVEAALVHALASSPAWLADKELLERLRQLCVTKNCVGEADSALKQTGTLITVFFNPMDGSVMDASLAQYNVISWAVLKEKVRQFPKGTTFKWASDNPGTEADEHTFNELKEYLEKSGMKLTR